jgi:MFS transporter, PHS family, inorganic phosphate transporter
MFGYVYYPNERKLPTSAETAIKLASSVGTVIGQISFGIFSDLLGRKKVLLQVRYTNGEMYGVELGIMIFATLCLSLVGDGLAVSIIGATIFWRIVLGVGIGGDYPSSSVISSEFASKAFRGKMMTLVFSAQGFGQFTSALVSLCCTHGFKDSLQTPSCGQDCAFALDKSWRILYGFGIVPACIALGFRLTIPETIHYTLDVRGDEHRALANAHWFIDGHLGSAPRNLGEADFIPPRTRASFRNLRRESRAFYRYFSTWDHGKELFGTAASWFFLDVAFVYILSFSPDR